MASFYSFFWFAIMTSLSLFSLQGRTMPTLIFVYSMSFSRYVLYTFLVLLFQFSFFYTWITLINQCVLIILQAAALAFYILSALFVDNFVIIFVVTVFLSALDFWVVKNVSGRILVGLRWWNEINDLGESIWRFECLDQEVGNHI